MIGPAKRKGGNFARRANERYKSLWLAMLLAGMRRQSPALAQIQAAEACVSKFNLTLDPETMIRLARRSNHLAGATSIISEKETVTDADMAGAADMVRRYLTAGKRKNKGRINPVKPRR